MLNDIRQKSLSNKTKSFQKNIDRESTRYQTTVPFRKSLHSKHDSNISKLSQIRKTLRS